MGLNSMTYILLRTFFLFILFFYGSKKTLKIQNRYISMYQPQRGRTLGHLVSTAVGTYNSTILDKIRKQKQKKDKQVKGRGLLLSVVI